MKGACRATRTTAGAGRPNNESGRSARCTCLGEDQVLVCRLTRSSGTAASWATKCATDSLIGPVLVLRIEHLLYRQAVEPLVVLDQLPPQQLLAHHLELDELEEQDGLELSPDEELRELDEYGDGGLLLDVLAEGQLHGLLREVLGLARADPDVVFEGVEIFVQELPVLLLVLPEVRHRQRNGHQVLDDQPRQLHGDLPVHVDLRKAIIVLLHDVASQFEDVVGGLCLQDHQTVEPLVDGCEGNEGVFLDQDVVADELVAVYSQAERVENELLPQVIYLLDLDHSDLSLLRGALSQLLRFLDGGLAVDELLLHQLRLVLPIPVLDFSAQLVDFLLEALLHADVVFVQLLQLHSQLLRPLCDILLCLYLLPLLLLQAQNPLLLRLDFFPQDLILLSSVPFVLFLQFALDHLDLVLQPLLPQHFLPNLIVDCLALSLVVFNLLLVQADLDSRPFLLIFFTGSSGLPQSMVENLGHELLAALELGSLDFVKVLSRPEDVVFYLGGLEDGLEPFFLFSEDLEVHFELADFVDFGFLHEPLDVDLRLLLLAVEVLLGPQQGVAGLLVRTVVFEREFYFFQELLDLLVAHQAQAVLLLQPLVLPLQLAHVLFLLPVLLQQLHPIFEHSNRQLLVLYCRVQHLVLLQVRSLLLVAILRDVCQLLMCGLVLCDGGGEGGGTVADNGVSADGVVVWEVALDGGIVGEVEGGLGSGVHGNWNIKNRLDNHWEILSRCWRKQPKSTMVLNSSMNFFSSDFICTGLMMQFSNMHCRKARIVQTRGRLLSLSPAAFMMLSMWLMQNTTMYACGILISFTMRAIVSNSSIPVGIRKNSSRYSCMTAYLATLMMIAAATQGLLFTSALKNSGLSPIWRDECGSWSIELSSSCLSADSSCFSRAVLNSLRDFSSLRSISAVLSHSTSLMIPGDSQCSSEDEILMKSGKGLKKSTVVSSSAVSLRVSTRASSSRYLASIRERRAMISSLSSLSSGSFSTSSPNFWSSQSSYWIR